MTDSDSDRRLAAAILLSAVQDAVEPHVFGDRKTRDRERAEAKQALAEWLEGESGPAGSLEDCCEILGFDLRIVRAFLSGPPLSPAELTVLRARFLRPKNISKKS